MPSGTTDFRAVCGRFVPVFIGFMLKRAKYKSACRIAIVTLRRRVDGVMFGLVLSYFFWGSFLLKCGDVESNPGPPAPPDPTSPHPPGKDGLRQTRISTAKLTRKSSAAKSSSSPSPSGAGVELTLRDIMATLNEMREQMDTQFKELKQDVHDLREDYAALQSEVTGLKEEVTELRRENGDLQRTNNALAGRMEDYERRMDDLEGRSKRNNLIFYGLPRREGETSSDCEGLVQDLLTDKLDITNEVEFDRVHRVSSRPDSPLIARCAFYKQKVKILKAKSTLRGSDVFIGEDFSKGVRDIRRRLTPHLKKARQDGKRATMVFNHLLIDGTKFSVDASDKLVEFR